MKYIAFIIAIALVGCDASDNNKEPITKHIVKYEVLDSSNQFDINKLSTPSILCDSIEEVNAQEIYCYINKKKVHLFTTGHFIISIYYVYE